jgi:hypothetical protein
MRLERGAERSRTPGSRALTPAGAIVALGQTRDGLFGRPPPEWSRSRAAFVERAVDLTQARIAAPTALTISATKAAFRKSNPTRPTATGTVGHRSDVPVSSCSVFGFADNLQVPQLRLKLPVHKVEAIIGEDKTYRRMRFSEDALHQLPSKTLAAVENAEESRPASAPASPRSLGWSRTAQTTSASLARRHRLARACIADRRWRAKWDRSRKRSRCPGHAQLRGALGRCLPRLRRIGHRLGRPSRPARASSSRCSAVTGLHPATRQGTGHRGLRAGPGDA